MRSLKTPVRLFFFFYHFWVGHSSFALIHKTYLKYILFAEHKPKNISSICDRNMVFLNFMKTIKIS